MAKFLLLYAGGGMPESEAEQAAVMAEWGAWYTGMGAAVTDPGNPFTQAAKSISSNGTVSDVPASTMASGYTIISAETLDSAVGHAKLCPLLKSGGQIAVYEAFDMG